MKKPIETCCVVNQFCLSPANLEEPVPVRTKCFSCGQAVCTKCSDIRTYWQYGRVRLCDNCQIDYDDSDERVKSKLLRMVAA